MTNEIDRSPSRTGLLLTVVASAAAVAALAAASVAGGTVGAAGAIVLLGGAAAGRRRLLDYGVVGLAAGAVLAGAAGAPAALPLAGLVAAVLAWDAAEQAINVGEQLGTRARTRRGELVHAAASLGVGAGGAAVGYGVFRLAGGGKPMVALVLLLAGGVLLVWALRA